MPKVVKKVIKKVVKQSESEFRLEINSVSSGVYDSGFIYSGNLKVAQLTLIRCEESRQLVQLFQVSGITVEIK